MADSDEALLARVLAEPEDDAPRRALAARWSAAGDPRGAFVDVQLQLAALPRWHPERSALSDREQQLLAAHRGAWLAALPVGALAARFRRGFVGAVEGAPRAVRDHLPALVARAPVTRLELAVDEEDDVDPAMAELARCDALAGIRELTLHDAEARPASLATLLGACALRALRSLVLGEGVCQPDVLAAIAAGGAPPTLRALRLDGHMGGCGDLGVAALLRAPWLRQLDEVLLFGQSLRDASLVALAGADLPLRHLGLASAGYGEHAFSADALRGVAKAPLFASLESLTMIGAPVGEALPDLLANCRSLRSAWLSRTGMDGDDLRLWVRGESFEGWRELSLSGNPIGDLGARMLAMCHRLPRVLALDGCGITPFGLRELGRAPAVDALDLRGNPLPADAFAELLAQDRLPRATALLVDAKDWPPELVEGVRARYPRADLIGAAT